jgi:hypothetical protein
MNNVNRHMIRRIILEEVEELFVASDAEEVTRLSKDSADDQIDAFILKFEKDSIEEEEGEDLLESLRNLSLRGILNEQPSPDDLPEPEDLAAPPEEPAPEAEEEVEVEDPAGSEDVTVTDAEELPKPPLNIDEFTKRVARLAMNYETLLDIKTIIVNRAMNFLADNYDKAHVDEMKEILDSQFDFDLDGSKDIPEPPYAVGAYAGGTGQMGGGGGV